MECYEKKQIWTAKGDPKMRDRLVELIVDAENEIFHEKPYSTDTERIGKVADHLLAEGIIVPPCKVGDYVKVIGCSNVWRVDALHFYREGLPQISITNKKVTKTICFETFEALMEVLTREEAEKALAERSEE